MALLNEKRNRIPLVAVLPVTGDDGGIRGQMRMTADGTTNDTVYCTTSDTGGTDSTLDEGAGDAGLTFTSKLFGVLGNAITVALTDNGDGSEIPVASVTGTDIVVLADITTTGTATAALVKAAIEADPDSAALIDVALIGDGSGLVAVLVAANLTDGVGDKAAVTTDSVTYTAVEGGAAGNDITVVYVEDAAATAPKVVVSGKTITVTDANGAANDVALAVNSSSLASKLVVASGTATNFVAGTHALTGGMSNAVWA